MSNPDNTLLLIIVVAILVSISIAAYSWWRKQKTKKTIERNPYTDGLNHLLAGRLREAAQSFTEAVRANTDNIDAYLKLGSIFRQLGKPRRAAQIHLELSVRNYLPPHTLASIYRELACDHEQAGNFDRVFRYLDKSRDLDPECPDDLIIKIRILESQSRWKEASETLKKLASLTDKPNQVKLALYKIQEGEALCAEGKEHEGRIAFKDAMRIEPSLFEGMLHIAASYSRESRGDDAFDWLSRFIKEHPEAAHLALPMLEPLLYDLGRFSEVESILRNAYETAPNNRLLALAFIELRSKKGEIDESIDICERSLEQFPDDFTLQLLRLELLQKRGNKVQYERTLNDLVESTLSKSLNLYCNNCGKQSDRVLSRCPQCGEWRSFYSDRRK